MTGDADRYRVVSLPTAIRQFRDLNAIAESADIQGVFHDAVALAYRRLRTDPLGWGDPECRTRKKNGMYCHTVVHPLVVQYVVYEDEKTALIWKIRPVPGSLLDLAK